MCKMDLREVIQGRYSLNSFIHLDIYKKKNSQFHFVVQKYKYNTHSYNITKVF